MSPSPRCGLAKCPLWAAGTTSALGSGIATVAVPLLVALPGGVLVDRVDRRRLMILYAVLFVINAGEVVFRPAGQAMTPAVVPGPLLERANGWLFASTMLMQQIAAPLGGLLFVVAASARYVASIRDVDRVINMLVGDTQRITEYAERGFAIAQEMPVTVRHAFRRLVEAGYTRRLI